jgi:hypothetical protein
LTNTPLTGPALTAVSGIRAAIDIEAFDLTPEGLADAPAYQEEPGSIVHTGNS